MIKHEVERMAYDLIREHLSPGTSLWHFSWNHRRRALGLCRFRQREISVSWPWVKAGPGLDEVRQVLLHEIAHALRGPCKDPHGPQWQSIARSIGVRNPGSCTKTDAMPEARYKATCGGCGKVYSMYRVGDAMRRKAYVCPCRGPESRLTWIDTRLNRPVSNGWEVIVVDMK